MHFINNSALAEYLFSEKLDDHQFDVKKFEVVIVFSLPF